jgi:hypothetical protein
LRGPRVRLRFMDEHIRPYRETDAADVAAALAARLGSLFDLELATIGAALFERLEGGDRRIRQGQAVEDVVADERSTVWVAERAGPVVGFAAARLHHPAAWGDLHACR